MRDEVTFEIKEHLGLISEDRNGWKKEVNLVAWNGQPPKEPIRIDGVTEKCPNCGEKVMYAVGTGTMFHGASESYEDWRIIKHDYCPRCGIKMEREG